RQTELNDHMKLAEDLIKNIENSIKTSTKAEYLLKHGDLLEISRDLQTQNDGTVDYSVSNDFTQSHISPPYVSEVLVIKNYLQLKQQNGFIYSEPLKMNNQTFKLRIGTNGDSSTSGTHLTLYVVVYSDNKNQKASKYDYRIKMINQQENSTHKDYIIEDFGGLLKNGVPTAADGYLVNDQLIFKYTVRPSTYFELYNMVKDQNERLQREVEKLCNENVELKCENKQRKLDQDKLLNINEQLQLDNEELRKRINDYETKIKLIEDEKIGTSESLCVVENETNSNDEVKANPPYGTKRSAPGQTRSGRSVKAKKS
ncbi:unnamed protein product, partial [Didymodactylos carnosus]